LIYRQGIQIHLSNQKFASFLTSTEALAAKRAAETGKLKSFESLEELWQDLNN